MYQLKKLRIVTQGQEKWLHWIAAFAGFLIAGLWLLPSLTGTSAFVPADYWFRFSQWTPVFAEYFHLVPYNAVLYDVALHVAPNLWAVKESWAAGDLPLWNQYFRTGAPLLANGQSGVFAVTNIPHWLLPWPFGFAVAAVLRFGLMWFGSWLFARIIGIRPILAAAVAFGFCLMPAFMLWFQHPNGNSQIWFPWLLWSVEKLRRNWSKSRYGYWLVLPGLFEGLALLGGHFHSSFNITFCAAIYAMVVLPLNTIRSALLSRATFALSLLGGVCLAGPTVFPGVEFMLNSSTLTERANNAPYHLSANALYFFWNALSYGSPALIINKPWSFTETNWAVAQQYIGLMPWILFLAGACRGGVWYKGIRQSVFGLLAMGVFGGSMAFGWFPLYDFFIRIPPFSINTNPYFSIGFQGAVIMISALLWRKLPGLGKKPNKALGISWTLCVAAGLCLLLAVIRTSTINPVRPTLLLYSSVVVVGALAVSRNKFQARLSLALISILWAADVLPVWRGFHYQVPIEWAKISNAKSNVIDAAQRSGINRLISDACYPPNTLAFFGIQDVRAYDYPIHWRHAKWRTLFGNEGNAGVSSDNLNIAQLTNFKAMSMLALTGSQALVSIADYKNNPLLAYLTPMAGDGPVRLYRFNNPIQVAGLYRANEVAYSANADGAALALSEWKLGAEYRPLLEMLGKSEEASGSLANPAVSMTRLGAGKIVYQFAKQPDPRWLVVRESFDSGWSAKTAEGEALGIIPADIKFMAVQIPAGTQEVTLRYFPTVFALGIVATFTSLLAALYVIWGPNRLRLLRQNKASQNPV